MAGVFRHPPPIPPRKQDLISVPLLTTPPPNIGVGLAYGSGAASGAGLALSSGSASPFSSEFSSEFGEPPFGSIAAASGVGATSVVGGKIVAAAAAASGSGLANAVANLGPGIGSGTAQGSGSASGVGVAFAAAVGASSGVGAAVSFSSSIIRTGVGSASGAGVALGKAPATIRTGVGAAVGHGLTSVIAASFNITVEQGSGRVTRDSDGDPVLTGVFVGPTPIAQHDLYTEITKPTGVPFFTAELTALLPGQQTAPTLSITKGWNNKARNVLTLTPSAQLEITSTIYGSDLGYRTRAADVGGVVPYPPILSEAFSIDREMALEPQQTAAAWGFGQITLSNDNGRFDSIASSWNSDGRAASIYRGTKTWDDKRGIWIDPPKTALTAMFVGLATPWFLDADKLTVPLRDATYWTEKSYQTDQYAGTGSYEGTTSLTGVLKPVARGGTASRPIKNITPVLIDPISLIYQYNNAPGTVVKLYEGGLSAPDLGAITFQADTTNLYSGAALPGRYRTDNSRGLFQLGSTPVRPITCDVTGAFPGGAVVTVAAQIALIMLTNDIAVPAANVNVASFSAAGIAYPYVAGVYFSSTDNPDGVEAVSKILSGFGAKLIPDRTGRLSCFVLRSLTGNEVPAFTIDTTNCVSITPIKLPEAVDPPPYRLRLAYQHNHTVQTSDLNSSANALQLQFVKTPDQYANWASTTILQRYRRPNDPPPFGGSLLDASDAQTVVTALGGLWGGRSRLYEVVLPIAFGLAIDLGNVVRLTYPMDDLYNGLLGQVVGERFSSSDSTITFRILVTEQFVAGGPSIQIPPSPPTNVQVTSPTAPGVPPNPPTSVTAS